MKKPETANTTVDIPAPAPGTADALPAGPGPEAPSAEGPAPAASDATVPDIPALQAEAAKAREYYDKLLRTAADFDNFRKRMARERAESAKYASEALLQKLIPVLDNFDMALAAAQAALDPGAQSLREGVSMVHQQLKNALGAAGLEEISALHQTFDPHQHEAVSQLETDGLPEGHVVHQVRKGYKLRDRLLRPASVVVAKAPAGAAATPSSQPAETASE